MAIVHDEPSILILRYRKASIYSSIKVRTKSSQQPQLCCILQSWLVALPMQYLPGRTDLLSNISFLCGLLHTPVFQVSDIVDGEWKFSFPSSHISPPFYARDISTHSKRTLMTLRIFHTLPVLVWLSSFPKNAQYQVLKNLPESIILQLSILAKNSKFNNKKAFTKCFIRLYWVYAQENIFN